MNNKLTLTEYLNQLNTGKLKTERPFDKNAGLNIELGSEAQKLKIPVLAIEYNSPKNETMEMVYHLLTPVLNELINNDAFSWSKSYGLVSAGEVAKAYLYQAITQSLSTGKPLTYHEIGLQTFLHLTSDALVNGIEVNDALTFVNRAHIRNQFETMVSSMSMKRANKKELTDFYKSQNRYNMAYQVSLFTEVEFQASLVIHFKTLLNQIINIIQPSHKKFSATLDISAINEENAFDETLDYLLHIINYLLQVEHTQTIKEVLTTLRNNSFFFRDCINMDNNPMQALQQFQQQLIGLIVRVCQSKPKGGWQSNSENSGLN